MVYLESSRKGFSNMYGTPKSYSRPNMDGFGICCYFPAFFTSFGVVPGTHMRPCHAHLTTSPHHPLMPRDMGPHGPRTFTHDRSGGGGVSLGVSWLSVGVSRGPDFDPFWDCDPSQVTMLPP